MQIRLDLRNLRLTLFVTLTVTLSVFLRQKLAN